VRVRRSILTMGTHALFMAVTMAVSLPATPYLVAWLGESTYGGVKVVNDAFGWLGLLELGLGGALAPLLARAHGERDARATRETIAAGARAYLRVAAAGVVLGLLLTPFIPWFAKDLNPAQAADLRRGWVLQLAAFVPLVLLPFRSLFDARQLTYVLNLLMVGQSLLITGVSLWLARAGWGITGQAAAQVAGGWAFGLAVAFGATRAQPGLFRAILTERSTPKIRRALRDLSGPNLWLNVTGRVGLLSDNLVVGNILGLEMVTSLVNTQKLMLMGQSLLMAVGGASWAALAELHAQGEHETFNRRVVEMTRMVTVIALVGLVPVVAFNRVFFQIWLGPQRPYGGDLVTALAAVNAVLLATQSLWCWCFTATGKIRAVVPQVTVAAVLNIATSVVMTRWLGLPGPLIGSTVAFVGVGLWAMPWLLHTTFGTSPGALAKALGIPLAAGVVAAWGLLTLVQSHPPAGWSELTAGMSLSALAMLALSVALLLTPEDRALWRLRLAGLLGVTLGTSS
jgi:O-antigen/teichoic acid export membrane protein